MAWIVCKGGAFVVFKSHICVLVAGAVLGGVARLRFPHISHRIHGLIVDIRNQALYFIKKRVDKSFCLVECIELKTYLESVVILRVVDRHQLHMLILLIHHYLPIIQRIEFPSNYTKAFLAICFWVLNLRLFFGHFQYFLKKMTK